ncbi:MAG: SMC-Scp complex subunit ScpB [Nitrospirae bacterium]|nr:SMC-Scp complex subunit ScpB [Nitrospirota bacterium]
MENERLLQLIESLLFVSPVPLTVNEFVKLTDLSQKEVLNLLKILKQQYDEKNGGILIIEIAEGFSMVANPEFSEIIKKMSESVKSSRLSIAALETLSIIAYKQPATKAEVEQIRGVNSDGTFKTLLDRRLIKITGRKDVPGKPLAYGTTLEFLQLFGLKNLTELPTLKEFHKVE